MDKSVKATSRSRQSSEADGNLMTFRLAMIAMSLKGREGAGTTGPRWRFGRFSGRDEELVNVAELLHEGVPTPAVVDHSFAERIEASLDIGDGHLARRDHF